MANSFGETLPGHLLLMLLVAWCVMNKSVTALSNGVPLSACSDIQSIHGVAPQPPPNPFFTFPDKREVTYGDLVQLTLTIKLRLIDGAFFKGYLMMAIDESGIPVGTFFEPSNGQLISCPNGPQANNAVAHQSSDDKQFVTVFWTPPKDYTGIVTFKTTYLKNGTIYWVNTPAAYPVRVVGPEMTVPSTTITVPTPTTKSLVSNPGTEENDYAITADDSTVVITTEDDTESTDFLSTTVTDPPVIETTITKAPSSAFSFKIKLDDVLLLAGLASGLSFVSNP